MPSNIDFSFDLETLGLGADAVVTSIAVVPFYRYHLNHRRDGFRIDLGVKPQFDINRVIDPGVVAWWFSQEIEAQVKHVNVDRVHPKNALLELTAFIENAAGGQNVVVWGNPSSFDITMLVDLYNDYDLPVPWAYYNTRDLPTLVEDAGMSKTDFAFEGVRHDALDDANHQAKIIQGCSEKLKALRAK